MPDASTPLLLQETRSFARRLAFLVGALVLISCPFTVLMPFKLEPTPLYGLIFAWLASGALELPFVALFFLVIFVDMLSGFCLGTTFLKTIFFAELIFTIRSLFLRQPFWLMWFYFGVCLFIHGVGVFFISRLLHAETPGLLTRLWSFLLVLMSYPLVFFLLNTLAVFFEVVLNWLIHVRSR